jgi:hypothetical protein
VLKDEACVRCDAAFFCRPKGTQFFAPAQLKKQNTKTSCRKLVFPRLWYAYCYSLLVLSPVVAACTFVSYEQSHFSDPANERPPLFNTEPLS